MSYFVFFKNIIAPQNFISTLTRKDHFYSHRGRKPEIYGDVIDVDHSYAIVFAVEMEKDKIDLAPAIEESIETSRIYVKISIVGMILAYYLRRLGYEARNHMDANYLLPLPSLAEEAGLRAPVPGR